MKSVALAFVVGLAGCASAPTDPFATPSAPRTESRVVRTVLSINPEQPALRPDEKADDYKEPLPIEWRSRVEQGMLRFFEREGVDFIKTPGAYIFIPEKHGQTLGTARRKYYIVIVQTPENLAKIEKILQRFRNDN